jgi:hypothetical protein
MKGLAGYAYRYPILLRLDKGSGLVICAKDYSVYITLPAIFIFFSHNQL